MKVTFTVFALSFGLCTATRITLTNNDNGRALNVKHGDDVNVRLTKLGAGSAWSGPTVSNSQVLSAKAVSIQPNGDASAMFQASSSGTSAIRATQRCNNGKCPVWSVTIHVE
jgi:hypothetical protein